MFQNMSNKWFIVLVLLGTVGVFFLALRITSKPEPLR